MDKVESTPVAILGAGVTGLAAATQLGNRAVVLEADDLPGGLVRDERLGQWWFDRVLHLLYFHDARTERLVRHLIGPELADCPPVAFVETPHGTTRFPFQMHLGSLPPEIVVRCLADLVSTLTDPNDGPPRDFEEMLLRTFGLGMCEAFLYPYNLKVWKRPLSSLAPSGFQWNITRPDLKGVIAGAINPQLDFQPYNARGFYPRHRGSNKVRGMARLSMALARHAPGLRCRSQVTSIDAASRVVHFVSGGRQRALQWQNGCLSTLPLPNLIALCSDAPERLRQQAAGLLRNAVDMVYLAIEGPRPDGFGHWRYYGDPSVSFNRLISMTEFDPAAAPPEGWGLMGEITSRAEDPAPAGADLIRVVEADARRVGALRPYDRVVASSSRRVDPAYVVFPAVGDAAEEAREWLAQQGINSLGRYGRWEYSSMAQCLRDGFVWGYEAAGRLGHAPPDGIGWKEAGE